jgi:hypothetical protein
MSGVSIDPNPYYPDVMKAVGKLAERDLRNDVLPSLLRELNYVDVRVLHGPREAGKDLLAWRMSEIDTPEWVGFVVKVGDITAQVTSVSGIRTVLHQAEQVLDHEIIGNRSMNPVLAANASGSAYVRAGQTGRHQHR